MSCAMHYLRLSVLADGDAAVAAAKLDVKVRDAGHADLVVGAREERRESAAEWHVTHARGDTASDAHHVLLGDEALDETFRELFLHTD